jgi:orotate phosphoribosyltransferase
MSSAPLSADAIAFCKASKRHPKMDEVLAEDAAFAANYKEVVAGIVRNVKSQPGGFKATSGIVIPYYLNLSTNFMDPTVAPKIVTMVSSMLLKLRSEVTSDPDERIAVVGMEVAGGMMITQIAAMASPELQAKFDFVYMRKTRKSTGTAQQLEGLKEYTERDASSKPVKVIWVDDVNSTGSSLLAGVTTLAEDYNMHTKVAVYVVDRSVDRAALPEERMHLAKPRFFGGETVVRALMDLSEIDALVPKE